MNWFGFCEQFSVFILSEVGQNGSLSKENTLHDFFFPIRYGSILRKEKNIPSESGDVKKSPEGADERWKVNQGCSKR